MSTTTLRVLCGLLTAVPLLFGSIDIVPRPARMEVGTGVWQLTAATRIVGPEAHKLAGVLGLTLAVANSPKPGDIVLSLGRPDLGEEGYELVVNPKEVRIGAHGPAGLFYGMQTLRQLLPAAAWRRAAQPGAVWTAPAVRIVDTPRFGWRGVMLDPARHFLPKEAVFQVIDLMAMHKLNRLQLHLTDDQGWRIEIKSFPALTARASWRDGTLIGHLGDKPERYDSIPNGGFYTQDDAREMVAYAAARHITIVPEIEMPGHARAWLTAYPEYGVFPENRVTVWGRWGVSQDLLAPRPATLEACRRILDEICELFPSPWIHTGGDESPKAQWKQSPEIQKMIKDLGLHDEEALQAWFTAQLSKHLESKGRRLVGWDEILAGGSSGLAQGAVVMSWRGEEGGKTAAAAGHDAIMAPYQWTYLDYNQGPPNEEPLAIGGSNSLAHVYNYEPVPAGLPENANRRILGSQMQVWSEYMPSSDQVLYMLFPRACALAEDFWSPRDGKDLNGFLTRLEAHVERLKVLGIPYRPLGRRTALADASGRIALPAADAVVQGVDAVHSPEQTLTGWKDPETLVGWAVEFPKAGSYRVRIQVAPVSHSETSLEALVAGTTLKAAVPAGQESVDLGVVKAEGPGRHLVFLRAGGKSPFPVLRGAELVPER